MWEELSKQWPVITGGLLAIAGGATAQILSHVFAEKRESKKLREERLERLVRVLWDHAAWVQDYFSAAFDSEKFVAPEPINEARMLTALYFPELAADLARFTEVSHALVKHAQDARQAAHINKNSFAENLTAEKLLTDSKSLGTEVMRFSLKARETLRAERG